MTAGRLSRRSRSASVSGRHDEQQQCAPHLPAGTGEELLDDLRCRLEDTGLLDGPLLETLHVIRKWTDEREKQLMAAQRAAAFPQPQAQRQFEPYQDLPSHLSAVGQAVASMQPAAADPAPAYYVAGAPTSAGPAPAQAAVVQVRPVYSTTVHNPYGDGALLVQTTRRAADLPPAQSQPALAAALPPALTPASFLAGTSPLVFMTLTHDAIRSGMGKAVELLSSPDGVAEGCKLLEQTSRLIDLHTRQEDEVFFPLLKRRMPHAMRMHEDHDEASSKRKSLVAKVSRLVGQGVDSNMLAQVRRMHEDYEQHMNGEERELAPVISHLLQSDSSVLHNAVHELIKHDLTELAAHAVPFTTFQLCRTAPYESIATYASSLRKHLTNEAYLGISKVMLMSAFEAKPKYAAKLVDDDILVRDDSNTLPTSASMLMSAGGAIPRTRKGVACWLEKEQETTWDWKDVDVERDPGEVDALMRAERLHLKLAERFAEPLQLRHVMVEKAEDTNEQTIYFFIDNTWEMARRALFAKLYTRMHKERGRKLHVVIVDAKERRTLARREQEGVRPVEQIPKKRGKGTKKSSDEEESDDL